MMDSITVTLIIANTTILAGSILSHSAIWYRIGKIENILKNLEKKNLGGEKRKCTRLT